MQFAMRVQPYSIRQNRFGVAGFCAEMMSVGGALGWRCKMPDQWASAGRQSRRGQVAAAVDLLVLHGADH